MEVLYRQWKEVKTTVRLGSVMVVENEISHQWSIRGIKGKRQNSCVHGFVMEILHKI